MLTTRWRSSTTSLLSPVTESENLAWGGTLPALMGPGTLRDDSGRPDLRRHSMGGTVDKPDQGSGCLPEVATSLSREKQFSVFTRRRIACAFAFALCHNGLMDDFPRTVPVLEPLRLQAEGAVVEVDPDRRLVRVVASLGGRDGWKLEVVEP